MSNEGHQCLIKPLIMKKKLLSIALALVTTCSFAQLTERENDATMVKLGARPQSGNMALTFGYDFGSAIGGSGSADASLFKGNFFGQGDFLTFKYFNSDDIAIRVAIRLSKHSNKLKGTGLGDSTSTYYPISPTANNVSIFISGISQL